MTISLVQHVSTSAKPTSGTSATTAATFGSNITAGNCIVACISLQSQLGSAPAVTSVNTNGSAENWASALSTSHFTSVRTAAYVDPNSSGGTNIVNVNWTFGGTASASSNPAICVDLYEFSGVVASSPVDKTVSSFGTTGTSWTSTATATTTQADEVFIGVVNSRCAGAANDTFTGPSSPWTNETQVNQTYQQGSVNQFFNTLSGFKVVSSTGTATYNGTESPNGTAGYDAVAITLLALTTTTTSGSLSMSPMSLSGTAAGGNTTTTGSVAFDPMKLHGTAAETFTASGTLPLSPMSLSGSAVVKDDTTGTLPLSPMKMSGTAALTFSSSGSLAMSPMKLAGTDSEIFSCSGSLSLSPMAMSGFAPQGLPFPTAPLPFQIEILLNGTWTDITEFVYQRDPITINRGRPDETQGFTLQSMNLTLNNRDGRFSPKNSSGAYYPFVTRNTQIRVFINYAIARSGSFYNGYRFWGEVSAWPPQWDVTGKDVYVQITASGVLRRLQQGAPIGSALYRYYTRVTGNDVPIAYWPVEDGTASTSIAETIANGVAVNGTFTGNPSFSSDTSFGGSDAIASINGSVWTLSTGVVGNPLSSATNTYSTPGTYTFTVPPGVTAITNVFAVGGGGGGDSGTNVSPHGSFVGGPGGGGAGSYFNASKSVTAGDTLTIVVGSGGSHTSSGSQSSITGSGLSGVTASGGGAGVASGSVVHGSGGVGSTHNGGNGGNNQDPASGGGGGGSAGSAGNGNSGSIPSGGAAVTGGGAGGNGGDSSALPNSGFGSQGSRPGGGGGGGIVDYSSGGGVVYQGGNGAAGQVQFSFSGGMTPAVPANIWRFLLHIPSGGTTDGAVVARMFTLGTIFKTDVIYHTGGFLQLKGFNSGGSTLFTSTSTAFTADDNPMLVEVTLNTNSTSMDWKLQAYEPGGSSAIASVSGTQASASIGEVTSIVVNPNGTITDSTSVGHVSVQHFSDTMTTVASAVNGYSGERAGTRFTRLCTEQGITGTLAGNSSDTPQMGPQIDDTLTNLLQAIEDFDHGQLYEPRDFFGLTYRTRVDLQNQAAVLTLDYSAAELADKLQPVIDDQRTRNDVTVTRTNASSARQVLSSGTMSINDPPNGVGDYTYSLTVPAFSDTQLPNCALWIMDVGTVDEYRYPQVTIDLARVEVENLMNQIASLDVGDYLKVVNPPSFLTPDDIKQLCWGFTEVLGPFGIWTVEVNAVPESVYEGMSLPAW